MSLIRKAYLELYPDNNISQELKLKYSRAFNDYNAKVKYNSRLMEFRLSHKWKPVSPEIQIGLIQTLLNKMFKTNIRTVNIDLYNVFMKKITFVAPVTESDEILEKSFDRINKKYFAGMQSRPNLTWTSNNLSSLGSYEYATNTIKISSLFKKNQELLDYIMYHEMLHKKLGYKQKKTKTYHHTREFKRKEKMYDDPEIEKKLNTFLKFHRLRNSLF